MSAIGDYIHRSAENYLLYGTYMRGRGKNSWVDSYNAQKMINEQRIAALGAQNQQMNERLNQLKDIIVEENLNNENTGKKQLDAEWQEAAQGAFNQIRDFILTTVPNRLIDKNVVSQRVKQNQGNVSYQNLIKAQQLREQIYKYIDTINRKSTISLKESEHLLDMFDDFFKLINLDSFRDIYRNKNVTKNTIIQLERMLKGLQIRSFQQANYNGELGEYIIAACGQIAQAKAGQAINESFTQLIHGADSTSFSLDPSILRPEIQQAVLNIDNRYNLYRVNSTFDKVDVEIQFKDVNLGASVKNYNLKNNSKGVHLQDINLIYQLAATAQDFGNHWLNIHSLMIPQGKKEMDAVLTDSVKYEALVSGNLMKGDRASKANTFIAIDTKRGTVIAQTTYDILTNPASRFIIRPSISSIDLSAANAFVPESYEARIANVLNALRRYRLKVNYRIKISG